MAISITYKLAASLVPPPIVRATILDPTTATPGVFDYTIAAGAGNLTGPFKRNAARAEAIGRYGAGAYGVAFGLDLSHTAGLTLNYSAGVALVDGPRSKAAGTLAISDGIARAYIWISQAGTVSAVNNSLTPPADVAAFLGSVQTSGSITQIDYSGRVTLRGGLPMRRTGETGEPDDTPPAGIAFWHRNATGLWFWDGTAYSRADHDTEALDELTAQHTAELEDFRQAFQLHVAHLAIELGLAPPARLIPDFEAGVALL